MSKLGDVRLENIALDAGDQSLDEGRAGEMLVEVHLVSARNELDSVLEGREVMRERLMFAPADPSYARTIQPAPGEESAGGLYGREGWVRPATATRIVLGRAATLAGYDERLVRALLSHGYTVRLARQ